MKENRSWIDNQSRAFLASGSLFRRVLGALIFQKWAWVTLTFLVMTVILPPLSRFDWQDLLSKWQDLPSSWHGLSSIKNFLSKTFGVISVVYRSKWYWLIVISLAASLIIFCVCRLLTNIYTLRKNEKGITRCQIAILITIGLWIVGFVLIFKLQDIGESAVP